METTAINNNNQQSQNSENVTDKQRFMRIVARHSELLQSLRKEGKASLFESTRHRIITQTTSDLYWAYLSKCITYKEFHELREYLREELSHEKLLGVVQLSIFDAFTDEMLVESMTAPDEE